MLADPRFRIPVLFFAVVVLHTAVLPQMRAFGVMPDLLVLVAVAAALVGGPVQGAAMGFAAGLVGDLFLTTPLGLSALVYSLVGYAVGVGADGLLGSAWWFTLLTAALGSAGGVALFALVGATLGEGDLLGAHLVAIMAVVGTANALLAPWMVRFVRWAVAGLGERPAGHPLGTR